jgi:hypothetical protein
MAIDVSRAFGPAPAARKVPPFRYETGPDGQPKPIPTHPSTIVRWITKGVKVKGEGGKARIVRLEAVRLGGRWLTDDEALARFAERLTPTFSGDDAPSRSPSSRSRAAEAADRALVAAGF